MFQIFPTVLRVLFDILVFRLIPLLIQRTLTQIHTHIPLVSKLIFPSFACFQSLQIRPHTHNRSINIYGSYPLRLFDLIATSSSVSECPPEKRVSAAFFTLISDTLCSPNEQTRLYIQSRLNCKQNRTFFFQFIRNLDSFS